MQSDSEVILNIQLRLKSAKHKNSGNWTQLELPKMVHVLIKDLFTN